jgi:hypothetical protein
MQLLTFHDCVRFHPRGNSTVWSHRWNSSNWAQDTWSHFVGTRSFFVLFCMVFCCNISCIFSEDAGRQEEELWFKLNLVSFGWELHRPLCFCASQLLHAVRFLALLEQALATSHINRWFQEWNLAMRSLIFLWFVCTRYLFWFFPQYKFEMQAFLKFCDAAGSKFWSIAKRLRLRVIERGFMKLMRMYHLYTSNSSASPSAF